jgi:molybdopterin-biosynthesis enzyme MoeA-like protein
VAESGKENKQVDVVTTSVTVGPAHDDVSIKSVTVTLGSDIESSDEWRKC